MLTSGRPIVKWSERIFMDIDEKQQVSATEAQEATSAPEVEQDVQQVESETESSIEEVSEVGDSEVQETEPEHRPTRAEKRIGQLNNRLKDAEDRARQLEQTRDTIYGDEPDNEPLIRPEELEEGIDPEVLNQRLASTVQKEVRKALQQKESISKYQTVLSEHATDLENVVTKYPVFDPESDQYVPDLEEEFLKQYDELNTDQFGNFAPRKRAGEIAERLVRLWERGGNTQASKVTGKIVQQASEQALTPNTSSESEGDFTEERLYQKAIESGDDADWAAVLKKRVPLRRTQN